MTFRRYVEVHRADAGDVAARMIEALDEADLHRIGAERKDDGYLAGRRLGRARRRWRAERDDDRHSALDQIGGHSQQPVDVVACPARTECNQIRYLDPKTSPLHEIGASPVPPIASKFYAPQRMRLCAISGREQTQQTHSYSITSSATASRVGGTVRPSIRAVWLLMTNSNFDDCTTGKSAGLAPLRIRPA
jgi:hypothetical protein